jgi:hypothetical protein
MIRSLQRGLTVLIFLLALAPPARAFRPPELSPQQQKDLRANFALCTGKLKGPYTENTCVCRDGKRIPIRSTSGVVRTPCPNPLFCAAFRAPWAEALGRERVWIANIFSRDLYLWDTFPDHHDLVRGYILEKFFTENNPKHKLSQLRAFGGLSGSEYEAPAAPRFFERYLAAPGFNDPRHFLLAHELQRRFFVREDLGQIEKVRSMAVRVYANDPKFKPLRDAIHNQISAGLIPPLVAHRDALPQGAARRQLDELIVEITKLTALDETALKPQLEAIEDAALRARLAAVVPGPDADPVEAISSLAQLMAAARQSVAAGAAAPADARRLIDVNVTAAAVIHGRGSGLLESGAALTVRQHVTLLAALTDAAYGSGLLSERERTAAAEALRDLLAEPRPARASFARGLRRVQRVVEWAQGNAILAFAEVWAQWSLLLPQTAGVADDILRASPLLLYAQVVTRLEDFAGGKQRHDLFGAEVSSDVRALNPGVALGRLRLAPKEGEYSRDEVVALPETPADLQPAAGILTRGEGNVLSHVQLLARALGIPNVVLGPSAYRSVAAHGGEQVLFLVTPGGRVILKAAAAMTAQERTVYDEYTRNQERTGTGILEGGGQKLHIDRAKIDLDRKAPIDLAAVRRSDSGRICGPKGAFLGELKHFFPDRVGRAVVVPFGAYYEHYRNAPVAVPEKLAHLAVTTPGEPLSDFTARTYRELFGVMIPAKTAEKDLSAWITPRLEIIQHSIRAAPLSAALEDSIRAELDRLGLLEADDKSQTVGCFVRSDTNVEDLDNFNGAGLNLTLFNLRSLDDVYEGLKEVWASPFGFRSFSWRQTLIDEPLWVLPSVVIAEAIPSEKSGVLVTADLDGRPGRMTVATSEGVGGAVDGTPAETLLWSPEGVELITLFKSPWKTALLPGGGAKIVPSSGRETVLEADELRELIAVGREIAERFEPARDPAGKPRPWDIEFGFNRGKLWLFQSRPFIGNDDLKNVRALASLEPSDGSGGAKTLSLEDTVR